MYIDVTLLFSLVAKVILFINTSGVMVLGKAITSLDLNMSVCPSVKISTDANDFANIA